jgi:hypothetical protein
VREEDSSGAGAELLESGGRAAQALAGANDFVRLWRGIHHEIQVDVYRVEGRLPGPAHLVAADVQCRADEEGFFGPHLMRTGVGGQARECLLDDVVSIIGCYAPPPDDGACSSDQGRDRAHGCPGIGVSP